MSHLPTMAETAIWMHVNAKPLDLSEWDPGCETSNEGHIRVTKFSDGSVWCYDYWTHEHWCEWSQT